MGEQGALKLLIAGLVVVLAACSSPAPSTSPSTLSAATASPAPALTASPAAASPSLAASPSPSAVPSFGTPQVFPPGAAVMVAVAELNVREKPSTTAKRVALLKRGELLIISPTDQVSFGWGPVRANGYTWYPVMRPRGASTTKLDPLPQAPLDVSDAAEPVAGWASSDNGKAPFLLAVGPRCPTTIDLANVEGMLPAERLACFGEPFELTGTFGCGGCGGAVAGEYKPSWLASPMEFDFLSLKPASRLGPLAVRFAPDGPARPAAGSIVRVRVHVDDPRSSTCTMSEPTDAGALKPVNSATAVVYCRERLVVESIEVLGTDPSFPPG